MPHNKYEKEKERRDKEDSIFNCPCGKVIIGRNIDYDEHLTNFCPVYKLAREKLRNEPHV